MAENVKPIILHDNENEREYTLEFNRESIKFAESRGFKLQDVDDFPMSKVPEFFWYAFRMHHPSVSLNQAEKMLEKLGGLNEPLAKRLGELWAVPFQTLNGDEKNSTMTVDL